MFGLPWTTMPALPFGPSSAAALDDAVRNLRRSVGPYEYPMEPHLSVVPAVPLPAWIASFERTGLAFPAMLTPTEIKPPVELAL